MNDLLNKLNTFGLSLMGDGATIRKKPLLNILISGVFCPVHVAKVHDCSNDLANGDTKDAEYLSQLCKKVIYFYDPNENCFNLLMFDGAGNVQKAGRSLEYLYPCMSVIHGCEHVISLFCQDLLKKTRMKMLVTIYWIIYATFGSGCKHTPYSVFKERSKQRNKGIDIGLIHSAHTRMAGYFYSFHRLIRLKWVLKDTIHSEVWRLYKCPKKGLKDRVEQIINCNEYFNAIHISVLVLYPIVKCLRLADSNKPDMNKIYYFSKVATTRMNQLKNKLDTINFDVLKVLNCGHKSLVENDDSGNACVEDYLDSEGTNNPALFSTQVMSLWANRSRTLESDFAISGWLLSVHPTIFEDAKEHYNEHTNALRRVANKLFFQSLR